MRFVKESVIAASAERVFAFHEAPDAFERLQPPWQKTEIVQPPTSLEVGTRVELRIRLGPFWQTRVAELSRPNPYLAATRRTIRELPAA